MDEDDEDGGQGQGEQVKLMVLRNVDEDTAIRIAGELVEGRTNREIKEKGITLSDMSIKLVREKIEAREIIKDAKGKIIILGFDRIKQGQRRTIHDGLDKTPAADRLEKDTTKRLVEEQTKYVKDIAVETLAELLALGRFTRDIFQSKARFVGKTIQEYLYDCSSFWEIYNELVPQQDQKISLMSEAMRNMEYRINELLKENSYNKYLIDEFRSMVEKRN